MDQSQRVNATPEPPLPIPNPTFLPDRLLKTLTPVFIIRHPARAIPSYLRVSEPFSRTIFDDDVPLFLVFKWQCMVFDFYKAWYSCTNGAESAGPSRENLLIVIDGDKLVNDSLHQIDKLCRLLDLDPTPIRFSWDARDGFENLAYVAFLSTIGKSTGVIKSEDSKPLVLEDEVKKWAIQWDDETVWEMKRRAENAMEDYEYMLKHSI
ncbi:hypothetical protein Moror_16818 [Moniliophthora roreri MCA 2997]|nr:hypothetical protein Moror_16818 [Moniliophthora roreri MCA 2997]